ncbi:MAG: DUF1559 domain-containing protein [Planctomycetes bacterium]|nr:DUF1559 domain-containing protein [Planctomycetota bacterium]NOG53055.1 DUF1559 domain-containing protein [Planctomycetota bacterium]
MHSSSREPVHTVPVRHRGAAERGRGFTLIELLVVISIISLLIAILLPALSQARKSARAATCTSQLRQFGVAFNTYVLDYDALPHEDDGNPDVICWYDALDPYLGIKKERDEQVLHQVTDIKLCPEVDTSAPAYYKSYRFNSGLESNSLPFLKLEKIWATDRTVILFDAEYKGTGVSFKGREKKVHYRHPGGANMLLADWHVGNFDKDEAGKLIWKQKDPK